MTTKYSSEGFDLDAAAGVLSNGEEGGDVVFEIGGGVTQMSINDVDNKKDQEEGDDSDDPMKLSEGYKQRGNDAFREQNWSMAKEMYTLAIESTPGEVTSEKLLEMQQAWKDEQDRLWRQKLDEQEAERREAARKRREQREKKQQQQKAGGDDEGGEDEPSKQKKGGEEDEREVFRAPHHPHANNLAIYHCNRAAVSLNLQEYQEVINDCDIAILWNPRYTKAYVRRSTAYEQLEKTDAALQDAKVALQLEPTNKKLQWTVRRLQKLEDERMEKLKTETMDKLKDLGNSILGNFGLSLDNFKAVQDPNTGSYSINFEQQQNNK